LFRVARGATLSPMSKGTSTDAPLPLLMPRPQRLGRLEGGFTLPSTLNVHASEDMAVGPALDALEQALEARGHGFRRTSGADAHLTLCVEPLAFAAAPAHAQAQGYRLRVADNGVVIASSGAPGLQYGLSTLVQLVSLAKASQGRLALPCLELEDWPDFAARGVMLDVSRDKVPTIDTLHALIDKLMSWKVNQVQLYMEHTFAYSKHEVVWRDASPFDAGELRALDSYCAERHIELVPNQQSFGHMHRWLVHEPYRALAECPDGFEHPWNWSGEPYGLSASDPRSLEFLAGLYDELLPNFRSRLFNVGLDETLDLGHGRSRAACQARGAERVYLDFLKEVHGLVQRRGRRMAFWGDIIVKHPDLIPELPRDAIALEWGYEAEHPFAEHLEAFKTAGLEFYVCPGTSSWNSIAGRTHNAIGNIARAAREGHAAGASGLLTTDWGDNGHLQPLSVSYLGLLLGAAFSWNVSEAQSPFELDVPALLDAHAFRDTASVLGRVAHDLGNAYREAGSLRPNASVLFWSLLKPERLFSPAGVTRATLEHTLSYLERAGEPLPRASPGTADGALVIEELGQARDLLRFACRLGIARSTLRDPAALVELPLEARAQLKSELGGLIDRHRALWRERNRPGGRGDSARRLERTLEALS
jgi:hexosaminidase